MGWKWTINEKHSLAGCKPNVSSHYQCHLLRCQAKLLLNKLPLSQGKGAPNIAPPTKATRATPPFEVDTCAVSPFNVASIVGYPTKGASSFATTSSDAPISTTPSKAVKGPATGSTPTITHLSQHLGRLGRHCWLAGQRSTAGPGHSAFP